MMYSIVTIWHRSETEWGYNFDGLFNTLEEAVYAVENNIADLSEGGTNDQIDIYTVNYGVYPMLDIVKVYYWNAEEQRYIEGDLEAYLMQ